MADDDKIILTKSDVYNLMPKVHTFLNPGHMLLGADWSMKAFVDAVEESDQIEIGGDQCKSMGHGLVIWRGDDPVFIECDEEIIKEFEESK